VNVGGLKMEVNKAAEGEVDGDEDGDRDKEGNMIDEID